MKTRFSTSEDVSTHAFLSHQVRPVGQHMHTWLTLHTAGCMQLCGAEDYTGTCAADQASSLEFQAHPQRFKQWDSTSSMEACWTASSCDSTDMWVSDEEELDPQLVAEEAMKKLHVCCAGAWRVPGTFRVAVAVQHCLNNRKSKPTYAGRRLMCSGGGEEEFTEHKAAAWLHRASHKLCVQSYCLAAGVLRGACQTGCCAQELQ
jgi:hypothetical protein